MAKMVIYDPAMCCSTGVCGPSIDTELLRVATVLSNLEKNGVKVERYNLSNNPQAFVENREVNEMLSKYGVDILPITMLDDKVVNTGSYPSNDEFVNLLGVPESYVSVKAKPKSNGCCCKGGCC